MDSFRFRIAGLSHRPIDAQVHCKSLPVGSIITFEREPTNHFDPDAIKVLSEDEFGQTVHIGYVPAALTYKLHDPWEEGHLSSAHYEGDLFVEVDFIAEDDLVSGPEEA